MQVEKLGHALGIIAREGVRCDVVDLLVTHPDNAPVVQRLEILLAGAQHGCSPCLNPPPKSPRLSRPLTVRVVLVDRGAASLRFRLGLNYKLTAMTTIPSGYEGEPDLHHLQVLDVLLREHSLARAPRLLDVTQRALSKTLGRLRRYFDDPLFVRVALRMEPTPKALQLQEPVFEILERMRALRTEHVPFDPKTTHRTFNFCVVDAGVIKLLPPLVKTLMEEAP